MNGLGAVVNIASGNVMRLIVLHIFIAPFEEPICTVGAISEGTRLIGRNDVVALSRLPLVPVP